MTFREKLIKLGACEEAVEWVGKRGQKQAWKICEVDVWMLWLIERTYPKAMLPACPLNFAYISACASCPADKRCGDAHVYMGRLEDSVDNQPVHKRCDYLRRRFRNGLPTLKVRKAVPK
jgi:hypothetical protein